MFLPTLRAVAESLDRGIKEATVTELISGVRETYLKTFRHAVVQTGAEGALCCPYAENEESYSWVAGHLYRRAF